MKKVYKVILHPRKFKKKIEYTVVASNRKFALNKTKRKFKIDNLYQHCKKMEINNLDDENDFEIIHTDIKSEPQMDIFDQIYKSK
jgi:hypothetical protein